MRNGMASSYAAVLLAFTLIYAGTKVPDSDQWLPLLDHRSAVTHSLLLPLLLFPHWPLVAGLIAGGVTIHLAADLLSRKWVGYALIKVPILGTLDATSSRLFIAANVLVGLVLYAHAAAEAGDRSSLWSAFAVAASVYFLMNERYWPVILPIGLCIAVLVLKR